MIKKIIGIFTAIVLLSFSFTSCNDLSEKNEDSTPSLTLSEYAVEITSAMAAVTTHKITAKVENSSSKVYWTSSNKQIATVSNDGSGTTVVTVQGAGTAVISAKTEDGKLQKNCYVTITLTSMKPSPVSELEVSDITSTTVTLSWEKPSVAGQVLIEVYEGSKNSVTDGTQPFSVHYVDVSKRTYTVKDLITDSKGTKKYSFFVYGYLNGEKSESVSTVEATLLKDDQPPESVKNVTSKTTDHAISLSWTEPSDEDYAGVEITITGKHLDGSEIESINVLKGKTTASFTSLKANTSYTFTLRTYDVNENIQSAMECETINVTTEKDVTAPNAIGNISYVVTRTSVDITYTDSTSDDFKEVKVVVKDANDDNSEKTINVDKGIEKVIVDGLTKGSTYTITLNAVDCDGNAAASIPIVQKITGPVATSVEVSAKYTGSAYVTWNDTEAQETDNGGNKVTYKYKVVLTPSSGSAIEKEIEHGVETAYIAGLTVGESYSVKVLTCPSDVSETFADENEVKEVTAKKVLWRLRGERYYNDTRYLCPAILTSSPQTVTASGTSYSISSDAHVMITSSTQGNGVASGGNYYSGFDTLKYTYWLVLPSLSTPDDVNAISLMATDAQGTESGYYLYLDTSNARTIPELSYQAWWWSDEAKLKDLTNKGFIATLDGSENEGTSYIPGDSDAERKANVSFTIGEATKTFSLPSGVSAAFTMKQGDLWIGQHGSLQLYGDKSIPSGNDKYPNWFCEETVIK